MNSRQFLALATYAVLAGCDTSATLGTDERQAGTSSETQTELQAFADSVSMVRISSPVYPAARQTQELALLPYHNLEFEYGNWGFERSETHAIVSNGGLLIQDSLYFVNQLLEYRRSLYKFWSDTSNRTLKEEAWGKTRNGFAFSFAAGVDSSTRSRLKLDTNLFALQHAGDIGFAPAYIYRFGQSWEIAVPSGEHLYRDSFPVFKDGIQKGWMIHQSGASTRPILDWSNYRLFDLDGNKFHPKTLPNSSIWPLDSFGVFFGSPRTDSGDVDLFLPVSWRFLPGTQAILAAGNADTMHLVARFDSTEIAVAWPAKSESGVGSIRIPRASAYWTNTVGSLMLGTGASLDANSKRVSILYTHSLPPKTNP